MIQATLEYENGLQRNHPLEADESKKSVYWLKDLPTAPPGSTGKEDTSSGNVKVLTIAADTNDAFLIGGFQLQGMAKSVKVFVDDAERLVMSVRGIKSTRLQAFFKAQCVIPGGPRPVAQFVRLELEPAAAIHQIRWTLRMRDTEVNEDASDVPGNDSNSSLGMGEMQMDSTSALNGGDSERGQDNQVMVPQTSSATSLLQTADTLVEATSTSLQHSGGLPAPSVDSLTQHMADLTAAMRELTATIKDHQRFLQQQMGEQRSD